MAVSSVPDSTRAPARPAAGPPRTFRRPTTRRAAPPPPPDRPAPPPPGERLDAARDPQQREAGGVIKERNPSARLRQVRPRGKRADPEADRPQPRQQRHQRRALVR